MYLLTQNKETLMEFGRVVVERNLTGKKEEKFVLSGWGRGVANPMVVGVYPTEEAARAELRSIVQALNMGLPVYEVR